jgi:hypothetical protein
MVPPVREWAVTFKSGPWADLLATTTHGLKAATLMVGSLSIDGGASECVVRFALPCEPCDI